MDLKKFQPWLVWGIADLYFILAVTETILFGALAPDLQKQLHLTKTELGLMGSALFLSFGATQLITGSLFDTLGPRLTLAFSACVAACGFFFLSHAENLSQAIGAQIVIGAGLSTSYVGALYLASMWFSKERFSLLSGLTQMSASIVSASLLVLMALLGAVEANFRDILFDFSLVTLFMGGLLFLIVRKSPEANLKKEKDPKKGSFWEELKQIFRIPQFWLGVGFFSSNIGAFLAFSSLWNIPGSIAYGRTLQIATLLSATLRYGGALGALLAGVFASYFSNCSLIARLYSSGALVMGLILVYGPTYPLAVIFLIFAVLGFFFGGSALGFPLVSEHIPPHLKGTGFGMMVAFGYLLSALLEYVIGVLLSLASESRYLEATNAFRIALTPLVIALLLGCVSTFWLKESKN